MSRFRLLLLLLGLGLSAQPRSETPMLAWGRAYLADFHRRHPGQASLDGVHTEDTRLATFTARARREEARALSRFEARLRALPEGALDPADRLRRRLAMDSLAARRLELLRLRPWARNPLVYTEELANALLTPVLYPTAPAEMRLQTLAAREAEVPRLLAEARANLRRVPRPFAEAALEAVRGLEGFVSRDVPEAFAVVGSPTLRARFRRRTRAAARALAAFGDWLDREVRPSASPDFALGAEDLGQLLRYREGILMPLPDLLSRRSEERRVGKEC